MVKRSQWPSPVETKVLEILVEKGESYGLAIVNASNGGIKRGTVYVILQRMEEKGLVESRQEDVTPAYIGIPRRLYKITGVGSRVLRGIESIISDELDGALPDPVTS